MAERRALVEGLKPSSPPVDPQKEKEFVFRGKADPELEASVATQIASAPSAASSQARVPLSTRMRAELFGALKRASLERQLGGIEPNTVMDIVDLAVEHWLRTNGHIK